MRGLIIYSKSQSICRGFRTWIQDRLAVEPRLLTLYLEIFPEKKESWEKFLKGDKKLWFISTLIESFLIWIQLILIEYIFFNTILWYNLTFHFWETFNYRVCEIDIFIFPWNVAMVLRNRCILSVCCGII